MKKGDKVIRVILAVIALVLIIGFAFANSPSVDKTAACTKRFCPCEINEGSGACNTCTLTNPVFDLGIKKIYKSWSGEEIITCQNSQMTDRKIVIDNTRCNYVVELFGKEVASFNSNGKGTTEFEIGNVVN